LLAGGLSAALYPLESFKEMVMAEKTVGPVHAIRPDGKEIKLPYEGHPITLTPTEGRVVVTVGGKTIADSREALTLQEAEYPAVQYIPRKDVDMSLLEPTDNYSYCVFKGDCSYYSIPAGGEKSVNAVWSYEAAHGAVTDITGHVAFYPSRVDAITVS
jgi:uncharacterized protein (DUF427 family)